MPVEMLPEPGRVTLRNMLKQSQFAQLDELLEHYRAAFLWNIEKGEGPLILAYKSFEVGDNEVLEQIDAWIEQRPRSYQAHTAKAFCLEAMGAKARGGKWSKDTKPEQFELMERFFHSAEKEARLALRLQPRSVAPYRVLVLMAQRGGSEGFRKRAEEALSVFPASFNLRARVVFGLQPRWYGDDEYKLMEAFVQASQQHVRENPGLRALLGYPDWARGQDLYTAERYEESIEAYTRALSFGEEGDFLLGRIEAARLARRYGLALKDAKRLEELDPWRKDAEDTPVRETIEKARWWVRQKLEAGQFEAGIAVASEVLGVDPGEKTMLNTRGYAQCHLGGKQHVQGLADLEAALRIDPDMELARNNVRWCLYRNGKPVEAIKEAEAWVMQAPGNARARFELASAYFVAGDAPSAVIHFGIACKLGYDVGCSRVDSIFEELKPEHRNLLQRLPADWSPHPQEMMETSVASAAFLQELEDSPQFSSKNIKLVSRAPPRFPGWTYKDVEKGWVDALIYFRFDGTVAGVKVLDSNPKGYFELAAAEALRRWKAAPAATGGRGQQRVEFKRAPPK